MMNNKMKSLKKSVSNFCNKFASSKRVQQPHQQQQEQPAQQSSVDFCSRASSGAGSLTDLSMSSGTTATSSSSSSSGYGSSVHSPVLSVFLNLDNYFYDEAANYTTPTSAPANTKVEIAQSLLDAELDFVTKLRANLTSYVRPLSCLLPAPLHQTIFQNIEKILIVTEFVRSAIGDAMSQNQQQQGNHNDACSATVTTIGENLSLLTSAYELYISGYFAAQQALAESHEQLMSFEWIRANGFDMVECLVLPVANAIAIRDVFAALLELTISSGDINECDRLHAICQRLDALVKNVSEEVDECSNSSDDERALEQLVYRTATTQLNDLKYPVVSSSPAPVHHKQQRRHVCALNMTSTSSTSNTESSRHRLMRQQLKQRRVALRKQQQQQQQQQCIEQQAFQAPFGAVNDYVDTDGIKYYFI